MKMFESINHIIPRNTRFGPMPGARHGERELRSRLR
jgi:hypothetical protein